MRTSFYRKGTRASALLLTAVLLFVLSAGLLPLPQAKASAGSGTVYYVDASGGDDSNPGTSESAAWKTLDKVNAVTFQPGDSLLLKAGESWQGQLWPKGSGASGSPIVIDKYGTGAKPKIQGSGLVQDAVRLFNQEYWEMYNLDVSNLKPPTGTPGENLGDFRGIHVSGDNSTQLDHFRIVGVDVHDVTGEINWISGTQPDPPQPGIRFKTGWDGSKKTGGIVFDTTVPDIFNPPSQPTVINDVIIEQSTVVNTSFAGIVFKQYTGDGKDANGNTIAVSTGWGERANGTDPKFTPHTNIIIRNNYITQKDTDYGCNGLYLTDIRGGLVEHNVVYRAGTSGIEAYYADDIVIQYNEVYETQQKAGGADSNGIDPDKATTRIVIQYNYIHDNGDGVLICQFLFGDTIIRYNVIKSNTRYPIYLHSDAKAVAEVYNNTIYNDKSNYLFYGYGSSLNAKYNIRNNNIYSTRANAALTTSDTIVYENNNYFGATLQIPAVDTKAMQVDPKFVSTTAGPSGTAETGPQLASALGFRSQSGSGLVNTGVAISNPGSQDYAGRSLYNGLPDIGAFEYYTQDGSTTESINGKVRDGAGKPVAGAKVSLSLNGTEYAGITDAKGIYVIPNVPYAADLTLAAAKNGYMGSSATVSVQAPNMTTQDFVITSTSPYGTLTGQILDDKASPLEGAAVNVSYENETIISGTTGADGSFTLPQVPIGDNYVVTASKAGYRDASVSQVTVNPESVTDVKKLLIASLTPELKFNHVFDSLTTGNLATGGNLTVSASGGKVEVVELPSAVNKSAKLTRTTNSGSTSLSQSFAAPLKGIVTIEADIMRNDPYVSGNNWFSVPYLYGSTSSSSPGVSVAFSKNKIRAYKGATDTELMDFNLNQWYNLRLVVNTIAQTYDLYVDGVKKVDRSTFRRDMPDITKIDFYANSSNYGSVHVDNIRITQGIAYSKLDATLDKLTSDAGPLLRTEDSSYLLNVDEETQSISFTPTAANPGATIMVNGVLTPSGTASSSIALTGDQTDIPIVVTSQDGSRSLTYTVTVLRASPLLNSTLKALAVSSGTLEPAFDKNKVDYKLNVPHEVEQIVLTPTAGYALASITVQGKAVDSGQPSAPLPLAYGENKVEIAVVSYDGTANTTYTIIVQRETAPYGGIAGTVRNTVNEAVYGATVVLSGGAASMTAATNASGEFMFAEVAPGTDYKLTVSKAGYDDQVLNGVGVTRGQTTTVPAIALQANGPIASLSGIAQAVPGQSFVSVYKLSSVSNSVYSAVYGHKLSLTFDPALIEWSSAESLNPGFVITEASSQALGHVLVQASVAPGGGPLPSGAELLSLHWKVKSAAEPATTLIQLNEVELTNGWGQSFGAATGTHALEIRLDYKAALQKLLVTVQAVISGAVEGTLKGQYPAGAKAELQDSVNAAQQVLNNPQASDEQYKQAIQALTEAQQRFAGKQRQTDAPGSGSSEGSGDSGGSSDGSSSSPSAGSNGSSTSGGSEGSTAAGNSDKSVITVQAGADGKASVAEDVLAAALQSAQQTGAGTKQVKIEVKDETRPLEYRLVLPTSALTKTQHEYDLILNTPVASVTLPSHMLNNHGMSSKEVELRIVRASGDQIPAKLQNRVGERPVVDLEVLVNGVPVRWKNQDAPVTVTIPYTPTAEEKNSPEAITVVYVAPEGPLTPVPNARYDAAAGWVRFTTTHYSRYAVLFDKKSFKDLDSVEWARKSIETLAARGIVQGASEDAFQPQKPITRAEYIVMLSRLLDLGKASAEPFGDVQPTAYYYEALNNARAYGIASGTGDNRFEPDRPITREDTMVLTARALAAVKTPLAPGKGGLGSYKDAAGVSEYAKDSVDALLSAKVISGYDDAIHPKDALTRAQAAVMLANLIMQ
ncbi:hypothetical protein CF651_26675 [Paenibacillus rigui]|uniref:SLH domain-containing protein n=2 Tax=Paenibacillus rigui TaxID=554312 RepID=A0A229UIX9_9BACL|nr:hypothetical protein CF651_26675 [Paenibacillus rigui]